MKPLRVSLRQFVVMLHAVERLGDAAETVNRRETHHRAGQSVLLGGRELGRIEQVNRDEAHLLAGGAEVVQFDFAVAPAAHAVVDVALELGRLDGFAARHGENFATAGAKIKALQPFQTGR